MENWERKKKKWFAYIHAYQTWIMINRFCTAAETGKAFDPSGFNVKFLSYSSYLKRERYTLQFVPFRRLRSL